MARACLGLLHDQLTGAALDQRGEHLLEVESDTLDGTVECLVLALVQHINQLLNSLREETEEESR